MDLETLILKMFPDAHVTIEDLSERHKGHAGAREGGGGHYRVVIVSQEFEGKGSLERHRMVYQKLDFSGRAEVHALALRTYTPDEFARLE